MSDQTSNSSADYVLLAQLADEFAARYRAGQRPSLQEYIDRHPALAGDIRELFPAMVQIEQIKDAPRGHAERAAAPAAPAMRQLGDFRILREVGKGGMGVVYEAEQVSLGRHVALKLLPRNMLLDANAKRRFEREARSAARLHHTNIVPVFGVGEQDGMPYYVMQFIQGLGLDDVLEELKKLQLGGPKAGPFAGGELPASRDAGHVADGPGEEGGREAKPGVSVSAGTVARSLLTGMFLSPLDQDAEAGAAATMEDAAKGAQETAVPRSSASSGSFRLSSSSVALPGQGRDGSRSKYGKRSYWQSVASIGVQVAGALEYAHKQGIHHRDIKPSNLLLDAQGTVWVADFGLAKADDQQDLTHTGDILGTLRYLPPEAFEGRSDSRGDVYSLGLTLYEMLAFRPAFDEKERNRLIKQVTEAEPDRLGRLNRQVPQDLETIVHKAIEKDPARRYATAGALAEDLQRFLDDEPILARRLSQVERVGRWSRRHKAVAALLALLATVLSVGFVVMAALWSRAEGNASIARSNELKAQGLAVMEAKASEEAREQERIALERAESLAREDYVNRVNRAYREVQDDNVAMAEDLLHGCDPGRRGWEWDFVERLCNSERRVIDVGNESVSALAFGPDGTWAVAGLGGNFGPSQGGTSVALWDLDTGERRKPLAGAKDKAFDVAVSPDGKKVAAGFDAGVVMLWDVSTGEASWATRNEPGLNAMSVAFSPDGKSLAVGYGSYSGFQVGRLKVMDVATGKELKAFTGPRGGVNQVAFHRDGRRLAVAGTEVVEVWDLEDVRRLQELRGHKKWVYCLAYSPDGRWLATGGWDDTVKLRDAATGVEVLTLFAHEGFVLKLAFSPDSRNLVTTSEDRSVRLWEVPSGRRLATFHGHTDFVQAVAFRPDGREVATGSLDGSIRLWDLRSSRPIVVQHDGPVTRFAFRRDGLRALSETGAFTGSVQGTTVWDTLTGEVDTALAGINFRDLPADFVPGADAVSSINENRVTKSPDGKLVAMVNTPGTGSTASRSKEYSGSSVIVRAVESGRILHTLTGHSAEVNSVAFSPDGRRLATASNDRTIKLWDMRSGQNVFTLLGHTGGVINLVFSPDGNRIVSGGYDGAARVWNATPLTSDLTVEHDARYRKKVETLERLKVTTDDAKRGEVLASSGQWGMAAEAFARASGKEPDELPLRDRLIEALVKTGEIDRAEAVCDDAVKRFGKSGSPYMTRVGLAKTIASLGGLLASAEREEKAEQTFERLRRFSEGLAREGTHDGVKSKDLAVKLWNDLAIRALEPLGHWERSRHRPASALRAYQEEAAIWDELIPLFRDDPQNLATLNKNKIITFSIIASLQMESGLIEEGFATYRSVIEVDPTDPAAHVNLGLNLRSRGRFAESLAELKRGQQLLKDQPGGMGRLAEQVRQAEAMVAIEAKLPEFLKGEVTPKDQTERLDLAGVYQGKKLNHAAARVYADAFATDPSLADDLEAAHRYNAACYALLAASGQGVDAAELDAGERARLRKQALDWLRADLILRTRQVEGSQPSDRAVVQGNMSHWQRDPDLAGIRDEAALDKLPEAERERWHAFWGEVRALLMRAKGRTP